MNRKDSNNQAKDRRALVLFLFALLLLAMSAGRGFALSPRAIAPRNVVWLEGDLAAGLYLLPSRVSPEKLYRQAGLFLPASAPLPTESLAPLVSARLISGQHPSLSRVMPPRQAPLFFLPIDLNRADAEVLDTLPGIGPRLAERIIALREEKGGFRSTEELLAVKGIGPGKLKAMEGFATAEKGL